MKTTTAPTPTQQQVAPHALGVARAGAVGGGGGGRQPKLDRHLRNVRLQGGAPLEASPHKILDCMGGSAA